MAERQKRKEGPQGGAHQGPKRNKGGSGGRWSTPVQVARKAEQLDMGKAFAIGDQGVWVTFARGMNGKVMRELRDLCAEYGEKMYGIKPPSEAVGSAEGEGHGEEAAEDLDIEASIEKELEAMKQTQKKKDREAFTFVKPDMECVLFIKTTAPVDPVAFVRQVCLDARACGSPAERKLKYVNRLTPVSDTDRATEGGILKVARAVMEGTFKLNEPTDGEAQAEEQEREREKIKEGVDASPSFTYAIRPTLRNFNKIKRMDIINSIAAIVGPEHPVKLEEPDRVVLVELFQLFCGVSVVDGAEWERLKRYNVNELYRLAFEELGVSETDTTGAESRVKGRKTETTS